MTVAMTLNYSHKHGGNDVHYVRNLSKAGSVELTVDLKNPQCCSYVKDFGMPCRHMLTVFRIMNLMTPEKIKSTIQRFWRPQFLTANYFHAYKHQRVMLPLIRRGPFQGADKDKILRPPSKNPRGRPRTKRYKGWRKVKPKHIITVLKQYYGDKITTHPELARMLELPSAQTVPGIATTPAFVSALPPPQPSIVKATDIVVGTKVANTFDVSYVGTVTEVWTHEDDGMTWHVVYSDGDEEDLDEEKIVEARKEFNAQIATSRMRRTVCTPVPTVAPNHAAPNHRTPPRIPLRETLELNAALELSRQADPDTETIDAAHDRISSQFAAEAQVAELIEEPEYPRGGVFTGDWTPPSPWATAPHM